MAVSRLPPDVLATITDDMVSEAAASVAEKLGRYGVSGDRGSLSTVGEFVREECVVGSRHRVAIRSLYDRYVAWCVRHHRVPLNRNYFGRELGKVVPGLNRSRPWGDGRERPVLYVGIGLKQDQGRLRRKNVNSEKVSGWRRLRVDTMPAARTEKA